MIEDILNYIFQFLFYSLERFQDTVMAVALLIFLVVYLISHNSRRSKWGILIFLGICILSGGVIFLDNIGDIINFSKVDSSSDFFTVIKFIGGVFLAIIIGAKFVKHALKGLFTQIRFEHKIDRFFDALHSRHDRWF